MTVFLIIIIIVLLILGTVNISSSKRIIPILPNEKKSTNPKINKKKINDDYDFNPWRFENNEYLDDSCSLSDLLIIKDINDIVYLDLLRCFEWKFKRLKILIRDKYVCKICHKANKFNHVHHTYYLKNRLPWEIEDLALETLCYTCHRKTHEGSKIPVYKILNSIKQFDYYEEFNCYRCGGIGYISIYKHVENGICFKCRGNTIKKTVFSNILTENYDGLNSYEDNLKRNEYNEYIKEVSDEILFNSLPDKSLYNKKQLDDLPF